MNLILFDHQRDTYLLPRSDHRTRHLTRILRVQEGEIVRVGVVDGVQGSATVADISESGITLHAHWHEVRSTALPVRLLVGHPRPPVLQRLLRDLTALRVAEIHVFVGTLSESAYLESSVWNKIDHVIRDGLSQGAHTAAPTVRRWRSLSHALDALRTPPEFPDGTTHRVYGALATPPTPLVEVLAEIQASSYPNAVVAIGPERGFTSQEEQLLSHNGFTGVGLGQSTLRTETATIILTGAICSTLSPDLR
ncbi:MAG: RsmE family RNA methyltransferase [Alkalispirochaeta sp.]